MSNSPKVERKLAAIMFTDIAGFTESMSYDENEAITAVKKKRSIIQPLIKEYNGVFVKEIGDGTLSYFSSAIDASTCAVNLQQSTYDEEHLNIRVGLHIGDIVFDGQDVFGEGVNIASRLESLSPVGGVCVSKNVYDELENKKEFNGTSLGLQSLKGVGRLVEVYALKGDKLKDPDASMYKKTEVKKHTDDEVPSIAIIPFENKGAEEDVFYAYGISADLISDVSSAGLIKVAGIKDIEKYDYANLKYSELSKKLFVRYIAQGTLWKMGNMFQLSIELYDTKEQKVVWSDRWQENWENLPNIKSSLSDGLLKSLDTKPKQEKKIETNNPEAYEYYLKAKHKYEKRENIDDTVIVRGLLNKAIKLDESLIVAKLLLGTTYTEMDDYNKAMDIYLSTLKQSEVIDDQNAIANCFYNIGQLYLRKENYDKVLEYCEKTLEIAEKIGDNIIKVNSLGNIGHMYNKKGEYNKALEYFQSTLEICEKIDKKDKIATTYHHIALVYFTKLEYDKALEYCVKSLEIINQIGDKVGILQNLKVIGNIYLEKNEYEKALDYLIKSLKIREEIGDRFGLGYSLFYIATVYHYKGSYSKALDYYMKSLNIREEIGDKLGMGYTLNKIGNVHYDKGEYNIAIEYLEKSLSIHIEIGIKILELTSTTILYLTYKHLDKDYDKEQIHTLINNETENIEYELNFRLYELLEDKVYLETTYSQIQEKADSMDDELKEKFINYPIPKQIIEEYKKVFSQ